MRTLTKKYLGGYPLENHEFQLDLQVVEKYVSFSTELLRLSLLGIAGYGFLISNIVYKVKNINGEFSFVTTFTQASTVTALWIGLAALGLATATALAHRYFAADCVTHFVRRIRQEEKLSRGGDTDSKKSSKGSDTDSNETNDIIIAEQKSLGIDVNICRWLLIFSCWLLVIGAVCVAVAFGTTIHGVSAS